MLFKVDSILSFYLVTIQGSKPRKWRVIVRNLPFKVNNGLILNCEPVIFPVFVPRIPSDNGCRLQSVRSEMYLLQQALCGMF